MRSEATGPFRWGVGIEGSAIPHLGVSQFVWTGHDARWRDDLTAIRERLGPCWLRYPVPWERVQPRAGVFAWDAVEERLAFAQALGLRVVPGLVHFGVPAWLPQAFGDPDFPAALEAYAAEFARRLDRYAEAYAPINEPLITALFCGDLGLWPPHGRGWRSYLPLLARVVQGLARATRALRSVAPQTEVWFVEAIEEHRSVDPELADDVARRNLRRFLVLDLVAGRVGDDHPLRPWLLDHGFPEYDLAWLRDHALRPDRLGLDYYAHSEIAIHRDDGFVHHALAEPRRGFAAIAADYFGRYGWPLVLTETSASGDHETRGRWLVEMVAEVGRARAAGVPVEGLFWWPVFDHVDWDGALLHHSGHVHPVGLWHLRPDLHGDLQLAATPLVDAFAALVAGAAALPPVAASAAPPAGAPAPTATRAVAAAGGTPLVVHAALPWGTHGRAGDLFRHLGRARPILYLEPPRWDRDPGARPRLAREAAGPAVTVATPWLPWPLRRDPPALAAALRSLLLGALQARPLQGFRSAIAWLGAPALVPRLELLDEPAATVLELSDDRWPLPAPTPATAAALAAADLVLATTIGLRRTFAGRHPALHLLPPRVDAEAFRAGRHQPPPDIAFIPPPRLAWLGPVDERLDYELIGELAAAHPGWSILLLGPVRGVEESALPRRRNLYYFGERPYDRLPLYLAAVEVAILPFAAGLPGAEGLGPGMLWECLASGLPVVATPLAAPPPAFAELVRVAPPVAFADAVRRVLTGDRPDLAAGVAAAAAATWEDAAARVDGLLREATAARRSRAAAPAVRSES